MTAKDINDILGRVRRLADALDAQASTTSLAELASRLSLDVAGMVFDERFETEEIRPGEKRYRKRRPITDDEVLREGLIQGLWSELDRISKGERTPESSSRLRTATSAIENLVQASADPVNDLPTFPLEPTAVRSSTLRVIEKGDIRSDHDVLELIRLMWLEPDCTFYYYVEKDQPLDPALAAAKARGDILMNEMKRRYFAHPNFPRDYVEIHERRGEYRWAWEKAVVEKGPEYWQIPLRLSSSKKAELDAAQRIQLEEGIREQARRSRNTCDVFLSYASADRVEAELIEKLIIAAGGTVFIAPRNIAPGDDFSERIRAALEGARELWLLASPSSVKSEWVITEWGAAWVLKKRIVPILLRLAPNDLPDRLRKLQCVDLHNCEEHVRNAFQKRTGA